MWRHLAQGGRPRALVMWRHDAEGVAAVWNPWRDCRDGLPGVGLAIADPLDAGAPGALLAAVFHPRPPEPGRVHHSMPGALEEPQAPACILVAPGCPVAVTPALAEPRTGPDAAGLCLPDRSQPTVEQLHHLRRL